MSRPALIVALARVLNRPPTMEEYEAFRVTVLGMCPTGRVYVPAKSATESERTPELANLRAEGLSLRQVAKRAGMKKDRVRRLLSQNPVVIVDSEPA